MLKIALVVVVVVVAGVLGYAATRPDTFRVQRTATIKAPPEKIFPLIADLGTWKGWSPYEKKDPAMQRTLGSTTSGKGATYAWSGNKEVGKGQMEILEATAPSKVVIKLDFLAPIEAHNTAEFDLQGKGDSTDVTWAIYGPCPFISKLMGVFFNIDKMIGSDFEVGLANLKAAAER
jgi:uncharacterized protein YndB with AHSA1/START domain